jgi:cytidylate kinase
MIIAIDGTTASGKGTIAKRLSAWFGVPHMDTGRLYRAVGVAALKNKVALDDAPALAQIAATLDLDDFIESQLRSAEAGRAASKVAVVPEVRRALFDLQRAFATREGGALLDGRDIGTVIAPDADVKLWVDADVRERGARRWKELLEAGDNITLEAVIDQLKARDARDAGRADAPALRAADALLIDTTGLSIDAAVDLAVRVSEAHLAKRK